MAAIHLAVPNRMRAQTTALLLFSTNILGLVLGPTAVASITQYVFRDQHALRYSLAIVSFCSGSVACLVLYRSLQNFRRDRISTAEWLTEAHSEGAPGTINASMRVTFRELVGIERSSFDDVAGQRADFPLQRAARRERFRGGRVGDESANRPLTAKQVAFNDDFPLSVERLC
jgi:hypothetical protein